MVIQKYKMTKMLQKTYPFLQRLKLETKNTFQYNFQNASSFQFKGTETNESEFKNKKFY